MDTRIVGVRWRFVVVCVHFCCRLISRLYSALSTVQNQRPLSKYRLNHHRQQHRMMLDDRARRLFCSDHCYQSSQFYQQQLSEEPHSLRTTAHKHVRIFCLPARSNIQNRGEALRAMLTDIQRATAALNTTATDTTHTATNRTTADAQHPYVDSLLQALPTLSEPFERPIIIMEKEQQHREDEEMADAHGGGDAQEQDHEMAMLDWDETEDEEDDDEDHDSDDNDDYGNNKNNKSNHLQVPLKQLSPEELQVRMQRLQLAAEQVVTTPPSMNPSLDDSASLSAHASPNDGQQQQPEPTMATATPRRKPPTTTGQRKKATTTTTTTTTSSRCRVDLEMTLSLFNRVWILLDGMLTERSRRWLAALDDGDDDDSQHQRRHHHHHRHRHRHHHEEEEEEEVDDDESVMVDVFDSPAILRRDLTAEQIFSR